MTGFLPESPGVIKVEVIAEIRRLHFVENVSVSDLAKQFALSRPTIRRHLKTVEEPVYPVRKNQPHPKLGHYLDQLKSWLELDAACRASVAARRSAYLNACRSKAILAVTPPFSAM